jgi:hypothetical protein
MNQEIDNIIVCPNFVNGYCKFGSNCTKAHLTEDQRNNNPKVNKCYAYINSGYLHDPKECIKNNNSLCYHCAYGNCTYGDKCLRRHCVNERYSKYKKSLLNEYIVCYKFSKGEWCDGSCNEKHLGQCEEEKKLSINGKTCDLSCIKGKHQGAKPKEEYCQEIKKIDPRLQPEQPPVVIEEWSKFTKKFPEIRKVREKKPKEPEEEPDEIICSRYHNTDKPTESVKKDTPRSTPVNKRRKKMIEDNSITPCENPLQNIDNLKITSDEKLAINISSNSSSNKEEKSISNSTPRNRKNKKQLKKERDERRLERRQKIKKNKLNNDSDDSDSDSDNDSDDSDDEDAISKI